MDRPYAQLAANWNFLACHAPCGGAAERCGSDLHDRTETVGLSLGYPIASERYTADRNPDPDLDLRPLAFRVFTGLPGVKPTRMPNMSAPTALLEGHFIEDYRLASNC